MGKRADVAIWDMNGVEAEGSWDRVALLMAGPMKVRDLIVEGRRVVVVAGQMVTIDLASVIERQDRLAARLRGD